MLGGGLRGAPLVGRRDDSERDDAVGGMEGADGAVDSERR
jgi:hypothetical protein